MRSPWTLLDLNQSGSSLPPLLIRFDIGSSDYTVWLTDLTLLWSEVLDRKRIIQRSFTVETSIDPSEGFDQLHLFLQRITDALEQRSGTNLNLVQNDDEKHLLLRTFTPLPGALKPLEWTVELVPAPQQQLTSELVLPLLRQRVNADIEKKSMLQLLKDKDQVISKLTDKLQADGVDLGRLFPNVAASKSGKASSRQNLGKSVRGLGEFDEQKWQESLKLNQIHSENFSHSVLAAFQVDTAYDSQSPQSTDSPKCSGWWKTLRHKDSPSSEQPQDKYSSQSKDTASQHDFQRHASNPGPLNNPDSFGQDLSIQTKAPPDKSPGPRDSHSDSTTDESEKESRSTPRETISAKKASPASGRKAFVTARETTAESFNPSIGTQHLDHTETSDTSSSDDNLTNVKSSSRSAPEPAENNDPSKFPVVLKQKAKLGKIGGKAKAKANASATYHSPSNQVPTVPLEDARDITRPDIKMEFDIDSSEHRSEHERVGRVPVQARSPSMPRETSQERANRKREQLKRELEIKSQAGPKKKRKF